MRREINGAMTVGAVNRNLRHAPYSSFHALRRDLRARRGDRERLRLRRRGVTQVGYEEEATLTFLSRRRSCWR